MCETHIAPSCPHLLVPPYTFSTIKEQLRWRADEKIFFNPSSRPFHLFSCFVFFEYRPYKSCQFTSYRHRHFTRHLAAISKVPIAFSKPLAGSVSNIYRPLWLAASSFSQGFAYITRMPVMPSSLHQYPSDPLVAGPGYWPSFLFFSARKLRTGKTQITHKFTWRRKTSKIKYFCNDSNGT